MSLPIVIYHQIADAHYDVRSCPIAPEDWPYQLDLDVFETQLHYISTQGMHTWIMEDLTADVTGTAGPAHLPHARSICLTFDDGSVSHYTHVFPMLLIYQQRATFFVITDRVNQEGYVTWNQLREMAAHGMSIQSHSCSHASLAHVSSHQTRQELWQSKEQLEQQLGRQVVAFAPPGGSWRPHLRRLAEDCGYQIICTSEQGLNHAPFNLLSLKRLSIRRTYSFRRVQSLLMGQRSALFKQQLEAFCLMSAKTVLGGERYNAVRRHLLTRASRVTSHLR